MFWGQILFSVNDIMLAQLGAVLFSMSILKSCSHEQLHITHLFVHVRSCKMLSGSIIIYTKACNQQTIQGLQELDFCFSISKIINCYSNYFTLATCLTVELQFKKRCLNSVVSKISMDRINGCIVQRWLLLCIAEKQCCGSGFMAT